jgi:murein DD-endopeptidase MepM/ murein hydrolase activator NlpD
VPDNTLTRRGLLGLGAAAAAAVVLPGTGSAATPVSPTPRSAGVALVDPYSGTIPMTFPLADGTYSNPADGTWHAGREGRTYAWNHADGPSRAHDGVDTHPNPGTLPPVYAPLEGTVAAVCVRAANTPDSAFTYAVSDTTPPPWNYSQPVDDAANLPLYGNFVWIYSTDPSSRGYFVLFCHLQDEPVIRSLAPDQALTVQHQIGVVGDSGNAAGTPQLHTEIHYPVGYHYPCSRCTPSRTLTSLDPEASLRKAARRTPAVA